jgi:alkylhydroperoxidase/carboxymuconolactone decarboxylase family protein YurZ
MYLPGVRQHIQAALQLGATKQELMEVLELSATLSIHVFSTGLPILMGVLEERGYGATAQEILEVMEIATRSPRHPRGHLGGAHPGRTRR